MAAVKIYTTRTCPYCQMAVALLRRKGVAFEQIDVTGKADMREWLVEVTGRNTVPQVFVGKQSIGGYTDMAALDASGKFDELLAAPE